MAQLATEEPTRISISAFSPEIPIEQPPVHTEMSPEQLPSTDSESEPSSHSSSTAHSSLSDCSSLPASLPHTDIDIDPDSYDADLIPVTVVDTRQPLELLISASKSHPDQAILTSGSGAQSKEHKPNRQSVDWSLLEESEAVQMRNTADDDINISFLLARLERANSRFDKGRKSSRLSNFPGRRSLLVSVEQLDKLIEAADFPAMHTSKSTSPIVTDLQFWAALITDYPRTTAKLPCLLSKKIKEGVPPSLRGVVWQSMSGAADPTLQSLFNTLIAESSPYDKVILRDLHRTFPEVPMFRERGGHGQQMLGQVLRAFSLYDMQVGYCQGLAFIVGPLLMHMDERSAFCVLVRLMDEYDLRTMFTADMGGLHLRIFQFTNLLEKTFPQISKHLADLGVQSIYATQWFLSFFAVTCPLNILLRIYDVLFAEGAIETLIRVSLSLMKDNEEQLLQLNEEDEVMSFFLGRNLWKIYEDNEDRLIVNAMSLTSVATKEVLSELERQYYAQTTAARFSTSGVSQTSNAEDNSPTRLANQTSELHQVASRFIGRIWNSYSSPQTTSIGSVASGLTSNGARLRRTNSRSSIASTSNSIDGDENSGAQFFKSGSGQNSETASLVRQASNTVDLHQQIEDLVVALGSLQRQNASLSEQFQAEKEQRIEDRSRFVDFLTQTPAMLDGTESQNALSLVNMSNTLREELMVDKNTSAHIYAYDNMVKQVEIAREEADFERERVQFLKRDLDSKCVEVRDMKDRLFEVRNRCQELQNERSKLERTLYEVRQRQNVAAVVPPTFAESAEEFEYYDPTSPESVVAPPLPPPVPPARASSAGLRELRLARHNQGARSLSVSFGKRSSSLFASDDVAVALQVEALAVQQEEQMKNSLLSPSLVPRSASMPQTSDSLHIERRRQISSGCESCESLRQELVKAKTSEAVARSECDEMRNKLEKLKRSMIVDTSDLAEYAKNSTRERPPVVPPPRVTSRRLSNSGRFQHAPSASEHTANPAGWSKKFGWAR
ncbi:rab-GTPase-TBC domain-containing protein [Lipomyces oligophaga]|uniref:rab-GTPase-TBC domain-containing protein n=1 Tax=Lipomyces oligophaga TaxID=45792 RepID=UPI0034CF262E